MNESTSILFAISLVSFIYAIIISIHSVVRIDKLFKAIILEANYPVETVVFKNLYFLKLITFSVLLTVLYSTVCYLSPYSSYNRTLGIAMAGILGGCLGELDGFGGGSIDANAKFILIFWAVGVAVGTVSSM